MISERPFSSPEKKFIGLSILVLLVGFFYQLGLYPLFLEEPRRGIIALEMLFQDNLWVPTQTGDLYYRKPPIYNWVLIGSYKLFGEYSEFASRFFSVLSHLLLSFITYNFVKRHTSRLIAVFAAFSLLVSVDILFYFSTLGEIDLFYTLVTTTSLFAVYHYGEKEKYWQLFLVVYALTALGFLTKGLTSLPYTAITLLVYFTSKKQFKQLLRLPHFAGIALLFILIGGYFYQYSQYQDVSGWWTTLFEESKDKATGGGIGKFFNHLIAFPIETIKNVLPAGLLLPLLFQRGISSRLRENPFVWYSVLVFAFNFLLYWFSTEAKSRYIYPLFPFLIIVLIWLGVNTDSKVLVKVLKVCLIVILTTITIAAVAIPFISALEVVDNRVVIAISLLSLLGLLWYFFYTKEIRVYLIILCALVIMKLGLSALVPVTRQLDTGAARDKALGIEIANITKGKSLNRFGNVRMSLGIVFYLERERLETLNQTDTIDGDFYFIYPNDIPILKTDFEIVKRFRYKEDEILLIELSD